MMNVVMMTSLPAADC